MQVTQYLLDKGYHILGCLSPSFQYLSMVCHTLGQMRRQLFPLHLLNFGIVALRPSLENGAVGHQAESQNPDAGVSCNNDFRHCRHTDHVGTEHVEHSALGACLVTRIYQLLHPHIVEEYKI